MSTKDTPPMARHLASKYSNVQYVESGGFANVLSVEEQQGEKSTELILKVVSLKDKHCKQHYENEKEVMKKLGGSPRICKLNKTEKFKVHRKSYGILFMEKLDCDLMTYMKAKKRLLSENEVKFIFREICLAVEELHTQGVVHLDLKPDNILIKLERSQNHDESSSSSPPFNDIIKAVKLCDFGFSKMHLNASSSSSPSKRSFFKTSSKKTRILGGTKEYRAPELNRKISFTSSQLMKLDIYSLGVTLFVMITGTFPFVENGIGERVMNDFRVLERCSSGLCFSLVVQLMRDDYKERPTIQEVLSHEWFL